METDMEEKWEEGEGESPGGKKWLHSGYIVEVNLIC